jgi:predicted metal-dependent phosphoesterase TrpH
MPGHLIDLHSHTNESDGVLAPEELVALAKNSDLAALAITDHDTFEGYRKAVPFAREAGLELVHGIELNTRFYLNGQTDPTKSVHLLAYFVSGGPSPAFEDWLAEQRIEREARNRKLTAALKERGVEITVEEVEARGRSLAGRPHFASILIEKGYAKNFRDAFDRYLGEEAPTFIQRESKTTDEAIRLVRLGGGIPVIAHPIRIGLAPEQEREALTEWKAAGLVGLEIYHSEHSAEKQAHYRKLAEEIGLLPSGGSDFHGASVKPNVQLGSGISGNVRVPHEFLDAMRAFVQT